MFLTACMVACFTTELPGKEKKAKKFHATLVSVLSAIALVSSKFFASIRSIILADFVSTFMLVEMS